MIRKSEIVDAINDLSHDMTSLAAKVSNLQKDVDALKAVKHTTAARKCTQPRDKSGKFTKK